MPRVNALTRERRNALIRSLRAGGCTYNDIRATVLQELGINISAGTIKSVLNTVPGPQVREGRGPVKLRATGARNTLVGREGCPRLGGHKKNSLAALRLCYEILTGKRKTLTRDEYKAAIILHLSNTQF